MLWQVAWMESIMLVVMATQAAPRLARVHSRLTNLSPNSCCTTLRARPGRAPNMTWQTTPADPADRTHVPMCHRVRRPDWWCYPKRCQYGHEWGPGLITVSWVLCDCPRRPCGSGPVAARPGTWRCSATLRRAAGRCGTAHSTSRAPDRVTVRLGWVSRRDRLAAGPRGCAFPAWAAAAGAAAGGGGGG